MDIKDLLGDVPFNFQELNLPTPLNQSSIDSIQNEEYDMSQHKPKWWEVMNPFAGPKAAHDAYKGQKEFDADKQRRIEEEQSKGNAMNMGLNALSAIIQGNQQEQQYNAIPPDNLTPVQGSFGFQMGGQINQPFYGKSGYLDKVAQETMQDIDSEPITTKKGAKEKMKRAMSLDLYSRTSAVKGPNGLENNPYFNKTGYTPGTESMNNPYNIIPGQEITMENTPFPVQGIPINEFGEPVGEPIMMEPGGFYRFPNAFGVLELPKMQYGSEVSLPIEQKGPELSKEDLKKYQEYWKDLGFYNKKIDGLWGPSSEKAYYLHNKISGNIGKELPVLDSKYINPKGEMLGKCGTEKCAEYTSYVGGLVSGKGRSEYQRLYNAYGDAWHRNYNLKEVGGKEVTDFSRMVGDNLALQRKAFNEKDRTSGPTAQANKKGDKKTTNNQHQGVVIGVNEFGEKMVLHNYHGKAYIEPENSIDMGYKYKTVNAVRPGRGVVQRIKNLFGYEYGGNINKYQMGGSIEQQMSPVQTEKGEMVTTPDMTTTKTLATKRHRQMTDDEVTDVLPVGSMIWSNDPQMAFTRNEYIAGRKLEDMTIAKTPMYYSETETMLPQEDIKLLDGFTKKGKFTPADFAKSIKRRMPITDRTHDAFSELAKRENRAHRAEYLIPFAEIAMYKKDAIEITEGLDIQEPKSKFQMGGSLLGSGGAGMRKLMQRTYGMAPENQQPINPMEAMMSKRDNASKAYDPNTFSQNSLNGMIQKIGGIGTISPITSFNFGSMSNIKPQKAQAGDSVTPFGAIAGFATGLMDFGMGIYDRSTNAKRYKETIGEINQAELDNRANIDNASNIGAAGTMANYALQDPSYTYLNLDDTISSNETAYSDALKRLAADRQSTMQMNQASANTAALNPNLDYNELASMQANIAGMNNKAGLQYSQLATNTMLQGNAMRNRYLETLARDRQIGVMTNRQNLNALNSQTTQGLMNNYMGREQGIMDNRNTSLSARMAARNQQANYNVQSGQRMANSLGTAGYYGSQINWGGNNTPSAQPLSTGFPQTNTSYPLMIGYPNTAPGLTYRSYMDNQGNSGVGLGMNAFPG